MVLVLQLVVQGGTRSSESCMVGVTILSLAWLFCRWTVAYQFAMTAFVLYSSRKGAKRRLTAASIAILYSVAIVWVVLNASSRLRQVVELQNTLHDAEMSSGEFREQVSCVAR